MRAVTRAAGYTGLALFGAAALAVPRLSFPSDTGTWAPLALPATVVADVVATDDGVLALHGERLTLVRHDGTVSALDVPTPVRSVAVDGREVLAGTTDGIVVVRLDGEDVRSGGLDGLTVHAVDVLSGVVYAGTERGLHRRGPDSTWARVWPAGDRSRPVSAVTGVPDGVVFVHAGNVLRWAAGTAETVVKAAGSPTVALSRGSRPRTVWAGLRGAPLLLESRDAGRSWLPRGRGLGFSTVNDVAADPTDEDRLLAGGSGLADGTGNAGVERSADHGRSWRAPQNRLSNTHVLAVETVVEPLTVELDVPGTGIRRHVALPVQPARSYAATNGGGVYSVRDDTTLTRVLAALHGPLRTAEPLLVGLLALLCLVPAYVRLTRVGTRARDNHRSPTDASAPNNRSNE